MCRLFGFRSSIEGQVHQSLVQADNALKSQSVNHPDGWGVSYYIEGSPHIVKSTDMAKNSALFQKVSGVVSSRTVIAHIRKSTVGENNILNTHPFQYGPWVFAHNGNIKNFEKHKKKIIEHITPNLRRFILGDTDSETVFFFILSHLQKCEGFNRPDLELNLVQTQVRKAIRELCNIIGDYSKTDAGYTETYLTFILTNGHILLGHQGGKKLFYSTYKKSCPEKETCPKYNRSCENPVEKGQVNHLVLSSEPTLLENIWEEVPVSGIIAVNSKLNLVKDFL